MGVIAVETEEPSTGEEHLSRALSVLSGKECIPEGVWVAIACYNQLGIIWCERDDHEKAHEYLQSARQLFLKYK